MQDCKSPHVAVMICATLVNTQTHTHIQLLRPAVLLVQPAELKSGSQKQPILCWNFNN